MKPSGSFQSRSSTKEFKNAQPTIVPRPWRDIHGRTRAPFVCSARYMQEAPLSIVLSDLRRRKEDGQACSTMSPVLIAIEAAPVLYLSKAGLPNREQRYGSLF